MFAPDPIPSTANPALCFEAQNPSLFSYSVELPFLETSHSGIMFCFGGGGD